MKTTQQGQTSEEVQAYAVPSLGAYQYNKNSAFLRSGGAPGRQADRMAGRVKPAPWPRPSSLLQSPYEPSSLTALSAPRFILLSFAKSNFIRQFYCQPLNQKCVCSNSKHPVTAGKNYINNSRDRAWLAIPRNPWRHGDGVGRAGGHCRGIPRPEGQRDGSHCAHSTHSHQNGTAGKHFSLQPERRSSRDLGGWDLSRSQGWGQTGEGEDMLGRGGVGWVWLELSETVQAEG